MRRVVIVGALAAPLLAVPSTAFADIGVSTVTGTVTDTLSTATATPTTSDSSSTTSVTGTVSTVTSTVTDAVTTVTSPTSTTATAPTTTSSDTPSSTSPALTAPLTAVPTSITAADEPTPTATASPAPDGTAEAFAANVAGVVSIGHTQATANSDKSKTSATANALELGGTPVSGGTAKGANDEKKGTLLGEGDNPLEPLGLSAMPYDARTQTSGNTTTSSAAASLLTLLVPSALFLDVLHSESVASYTTGNPDTSKSSTKSYGAHLVLGSDDPNKDCSDNSCLSLYLLYAETDSSGKGSSYIANINGNKVITDEDVAGQCDIPLNPLIELVCVYAKGGSGTVATTTAAVLTGTSQSGLPEIDVVSGSSTPAKGTTSSSTPQTTTPGTGGNPGQGGSPGQGGGPGDNGNPPQSGPPSGPSGPTSVLPSRQTAEGPAAGNGLPFTGFDAHLAALLAMVLVGAGVALRRTGRPLA